MSPIEFLPLLAAIALGVVVAGPAAAQDHHRHAAQGGLAMPEPMRLEHEDIHARLEAATQLTGEVGAAARELATVLHPHFTRENEIALPPLGLLAALTRGDSIPHEQAAAALEMTDALRAELPHMLEEHVGIGAAARRLEQVARENGVTEVEELAQELQLHARTEEEVTYPAAVAVGMLLRARHAH